MKVSDEAVEAAAKRLQAIHWNGTGCGTNSHMGCACCFGPSPADEYEISREVLAAAAPFIAAQVAEEAQKVWTTALQKWHPFIACNCAAATDHAYHKLLDHLLRLTAAARGVAAEENDKAHAS